MTIKILCWWRNSLKTTRSRCFARWSLSGVFFIHTIFLKNWTLKLPFQFHFRHCLGLALRLYITVQSVLSLLFYTWKPTPKLFCFLYGFLRMIQIPLQSQIQAIVFVLFASIYVWQRKAGYRMTGKSGMGSSRISANWHTSSRLECSFKVQTHDTL